MSSTRSKLAAKDVAIVYAVPEDRIGNGIWGVFSTYEHAVRALRHAGLRVWDPVAHNADDPPNETPREPDERVVGFIGVDFRSEAELPMHPSQDPLRGSDGYPHEIELERIATWPSDSAGELVKLLEYVKDRWSYPNYWQERNIDRRGRRYRIYRVSTGGWSGNEDLVSALEQNILFVALAPQRWKRGGHYVWEAPLDG